MMYFELIKINKAVTTHKYDVEIHGMLGKHIPSKEMTISEVWNYYSKDLGMTKCLYGKLQDGQVDLLTEEEYKQYAKVWTVRWTETIA